jgi:type VI secretion system protein ImpL
LKGKDEDNKKRSNKKSDKYKRNDPVLIYENAISAAFDCYAGEHGLLRRLSRKIDACRKPRFVIGGNDKSGKTSFAAKSGLKFDFVHSGGTLTNGNEAPRWFFSEKAVYIDTHSASEGWADLCFALKKRKSLRRRAVDGLLFVIDINEFLAMDRASANQFASELREQADTLVRISGYEIPAYFIFTKSDKIEGFSEMFSDKQAANLPPVLGTLIGNSSSKIPVAEIFSSHYMEVYNDISDLCLLKVLRTGEIENSKQLYRFSYEFLLAESKLAAFFTEFFKYRGRTAPRFCGFFFTSSKMGKASVLSSGLLGETIPNAKFRIRETGAGSLFYWMKKISVHLLMALICVILIFGIAGSGVRDALHMRTLSTELSALLENEPTLENQFEALEKLRLSYNHLQGRFKSPGRLIFGTGKARENIRGAYIAASWQVMVNPAARHLETTIAQHPTRLTTEEHLALYQSLKAYLLLTGGERVRANDLDDIVTVFEEALKISLGQRYSALNERIVRDNINTVTRFAADGRYENRANQRLVQTARERLTVAPNANVVYRTVMEKLRAERRPVPMARIVGGSGILRYGNEVSALYTREGWEQLVLPEFINASKDPFRADWVMGPVQMQVDEAKLLTELSALYVADLSRRWLDFIRNTQINLSGDIARNLEHLASRESEVRKMLTAVCSLATQEPAGGAVEASTQTSTLRGQITNVSSRLRGGSDNVVHDIPDPFVEAKKTFESIDSFLKNGGFDEYQRALGDMSERLKEGDERGGFTRTFAAQGEDPIAISRNILSRVYANMPSAVSAALRRVLESPLDASSGTLVRKIVSELEESWETEVAAHFNSRLAGRYPFDKDGSDLSWSVFEDFFKPRSGILWKYYEENLSGLTERTPRGYERRSRRTLSVPVLISDEALNAYNRAARITNIFFRADGSPRHREITFHPIRSSSGEAQFWIGNQQLSFESGLPITTNHLYGSIGDETIILRLTTSERAQEELRFRGEWAMSRFFSAGQIEKLGRDRYRVTWRMNVRNIYTANIMTVAQSDSEVLFDEKIMQGFTVPTKITSRQ